MKVFLITIPPLLLFLIGCGEPDDQSAPLILSADVRLEIGTSFGFCVGYCRKELIISEDGIVFRKISQGLGVNVSDQQYTLAYSPNDFKSLIAKLDVKRFNELPHTLGCPDCADGGAEWIRIVENGNVKELVMEYGQSVAGLDNFLASVRTLRDSIYDQFPD